MMIIDRTLPIEQKIRMIEKMITDDKYIEFFSGEYFPGKYANSGIMREFDSFITDVMQKNVYRLSRNDGHNSKADFEKWALSRTDGELVEFLFHIRRVSAFDPSDFESKALSLLAREGKLAILLKTIRDKMDNSDTADMGIYG